VHCNKYIKCTLTERRSSPAESRFGTTAAKSCMVMETTFKFSIRLISFFFIFGHGNRSLRNIIYHIKFSYLRRPFGKSRFIIRQRSHSRPCILVWSAQDSSYKRRYVNIIIIHFFFFIWHWVSGASLRLIPRVHKPSTRSFSQVHIG
jgi:hypothetical protein